MTNIMVGELSTLLYDGTQVEISCAEDEAEVKWVGMSEDIPDEYEGCDVRCIWPTSDGVLHVEVEELPEEN